MRRIIAVFSAIVLMACSDGAKAPAKAPAAAASSDSIAQSAPSASSDSSAATRTIVFLGTSLTAGLGVGPDVAFPAIIQQRITAAHLPYHVTNAGVSGETSADGVRRIDWLLQTPLDVLVLELGANDGLRALDVDSMQHNLDVILQRTHAKYPSAAFVIVGMEAPPNLGRPYTSHFHDVFPALARKYNASLVPFLLAGVAGDRTLNQEDGLHPNVAGHRIVAANVWRVLGPLLIKRARAPN